MQGVVCCAPVRTFAIVNKDVSTNKSHLLSCICSHVEVQIFFAYAVHSLLTIMVSSRCSRRRRQMLRRRIQENRDGIEEIPIPIDYAYRWHYRKEKLQRIMEREPYIFFMARWGEGSVNLGDHPHCVPPDIQDLTISVRQWKYDAKRWDLALKKFYSDTSTAPLETFGDSI